MKARTSHHPPHPRRRRRFTRRSTSLAIAIESLEDRRLLSAASAHAPSGPHLAVDVNSFDATRILVRLREGYTQSDVESVFGDAEYTAATRAVPGMFEVLVGPQMSIEQAVNAYRSHAVVDLAEPNYRIQLSSFTPTNEPQYNSLWGLNNTGQTGGTIDADIDALEAWSVTTGSSSVVVAVIDTGVDYAHADLSANMWYNSGEIPWNGIDDDGNGFVDDVHGYDFINNDGDPTDDHGHGTHVAGTIAAVGGNGIGIVGVAPNVKVMALKFLDSSGGGYVSDAVRALDYAVAMGADISNNSWGGGGASSALSAAISNAQNAGHIFVAAAGNWASNNDFQPTYPAVYPQPNVVSVAATDDDDKLAGFSNYGEYTVDLAAPGVSILSTLPGNNYGYYSGTSMATPHVTGVIALVRSQHPEWSYQQVIDQVLGTVDPLPSLYGLVKTGGRANAARALGLDVPYSDIHGDDAAHATSISVGTTTNGGINEADDEDWFQVTLAAGSTYVFETGLGTLADSTLTLYGTDGSTVLQFDDDGGSGMASRIQFTNTVTGTYFLRVLGDGGATGAYALQATRIITVATPAVTSPSLRGIDTTPTVSWTAANGADYYQLMVYDIASGQARVNESNVGGTSFDVTGGLAAGRVYQVWVRGMSHAGEVGQWSPGYVFSIALPDRPALSGPGSWTTDTTPQIGWTPVSGADHYELLMFSATTGAMVAQSTNLTATTFTPPADLPVWQEYQVWARSVNDRGEAGSWSLPISFVVAPPAPPSMVSPGAHSSDKTPTISWTASPDAVHYDLLVYDADAGQMVSMVDDLAAISYEISATLPIGRTYQVWLRATNSAGNVGTWGVPVSFTVAPPAAPIITAPAASTTDASPTIRWTASPDAAAYELLVYNVGVGAVVRHQTGITATEFTTPSGLSVGSVFQVFVRAANADGESGSWSTPHQFSTTWNAAGTLTVSESIEARIDARTPSPLSTGPTAGTDLEPIRALRFDVQEQTARFTDSHVSQRIAATDGVEGVVKSTTPQPVAVAQADEFSNSALGETNPSRRDDAEDDRLLEDEDDETPLGLGDAHLLDVLFADSEFDVTAPVV